MTFSMWKRADAAASLAAKLEPPLTAVELGAAEPCSSAQIGSGKRASSPARELWTWLREDIDGLFACVREMRSRVGDPDAELDEVQSKAERVFVSAAALLHDLEDDRAAAPRARVTGSDATEASHA